MGGDRSSYIKARKLYKELDDFEFDSTEGDDIEDFVAKYLASEWNEAIVRHVKKPDWDELLDPDDFYYLDNEEVVKRALQGDDLLSLRQAYLLIEDEDDEFLEALSKRVMRDTKNAIILNHAEIGLQADTPWTGAAS